MNILTDVLPEAVEIDGTEYPLNTDYRVGVNIMRAFEDYELTVQEKYSVMLSLLYKEVPNDIEQAMRLAIKFLNGGSSDSDGGESVQSERLYSFDKDAQYIYTAIRQTHGIDLDCVDYLHWWKFIYLFMDLSEDCFFSHLIDLRSRRNRGKLTKEEREYCFKIKNILDLPQPPDPEADAARDEFMRLLRG